MQSIKLAGWDSLSPQLQAVEPHLQFVLENLDRQLIRRLELRCVDQCNVLQRALVKRLFSGDEVRRNARRHQVVVSIVTDRSRFERKQYQVLLVVVVEEFFS